MSARVRALLGVMTTIVFLSIGAMLLAEERTGWGALVLALGAFRGALAARQVVASFRPDGAPPPG